MKTLIKPNVKHYNRLTPEPIEVSNAFKLNGNLYPAMKYLSRAGHKGLESVDVQKAVDYLNFEIHFQTQALNLTIDGNIDLTTLWVDNPYRAEICYILRYTSDLKSHNIQSLEFLVALLERKITKLKEMGR